MQLFVPIPLVYDGREGPSVPLVHVSPTRTRSIVHAPVREWLCPHRADIVDPTKALFPNHYLRNGIGLVQFAAVVEIVVKALVRACATPGRGNGVEEREMIRRTTVDYTSRCSASMIIKQLTTTV